MQILDTYLGLGDVLAIWTWMRFILLFLILFGIIYGFYAITAPKEKKRTHRLPGALVAAIVLVAASMLYSRLISVSIKYALVYGSLASFIIMMIWLYTCAIILIIGNVFNVALGMSSEPVNLPELKHFSFRQLGRALMSLAFNDSTQTEKNEDGDSAEGSPDREDT